MEIADTTRSFIEIAIREKLAKGPFKARQIREIVVKHIHPTPDSDDARLLAGQVSIVLWDWLDSGRLKLLIDRRLVFNHARGFCHKTDIKVPLNATVETLRGQEIPCKCCGDQMAVRPYMSTSHSMEQLGLIESICPVCP